MVTGKGRFGGSTLGCKAAFTPKMLRLPSLHSSSGGKASKAQQLPGWPSLPHFLVARMDLDH